MGGTWDGYEGSSRAQLNSVVEFPGVYLVELLRQRLGAAPPFALPVDIADYEGACGDPVARPAPWANGRIHFITRKADDVDVVRFYADLDELTSAANPVRIDYEILDSTLSDADARELIVHTYSCSSWATAMRTESKASTWGLSAPRSAAT